MKKGELSMEFIGFIFISLLFFAAIFALFYIDKRMNAMDAPNTSENTPTSETKITLEKMQTEIFQSNYCESPQDCVQLKSTCSLGCPVLVNKDEKAVVESLLEDFEPSCMRDCPPVSNVICVENECRVG